MHEGGGSLRWLLTYADLITLLMVFFVVMYSISEADKLKFNQFSSSMRRALNSGPAEGQGAHVLDGSGTALLQAPALPHSAPGETGIADDSVRLGRALAVPSPAAPSPAQDSAARESELLLQLRRAILPLAASQGVAESVSVDRFQEGVVVSLFGNVLFDSGKAELKPEGVVFLHVLAEALRSRSNLLRIEGHTDSVGIRTTLYPSNWELSSARAIVAARYLIERGKLDPARVGVTAYGEYRPVADNGTRDGRARNRRLDVVVVDTGTTQAGTGQ